jgi:hypothetical protein
MIAASQGIMSGGLTLVQLTGHFDHRPPEADSREEPLRWFVPFGGRQDDLTRASRLHDRQRFVEQSPADATTAMVGIDKHVVQQRRRSSQRLVVVSFHHHEGVADHACVLLRHEHERIRIIELRTEKFSVMMRRTRVRDKKAAGIEIVMLLHEKCAKPAETWKVGVGRTANDKTGQWPYPFGTRPLGVIVSTACGRIVDNFCVRSWTERPDFVASC